jgi:Methyltransferase domain
MGPEPVAGHPTPGMHIWGWMSPEELEWLGSEAAEMDSVVEIGSLHGRSAFALLAACSGPVYCIDPWDDEHDLSYDSFMGSCGHFPNLVAVRGFSPDVADQIPDVDMTFIDGNHDYEAVLADIDAWLPKTRKLICGHDYGRIPSAGFPGAGWPGVIEGVNERFGDRVECALLKGWDPEDSSIWVVRV